MEKIKKLNLIIKPYIAGRFFWGSIILISSLLIIAALYFQEIMNLKPCFLCINQRIAIFIIGISAILGFFFINKKKATYFSFLLFFIGSLFGLIVATYQTYLQINPPKFSSCGAGMDHILANNSLMEALPLLLKPTGDCSDIQWVFLSLSMPQWMMVVFSMFLFVNLYSLFLYSRVK